MDRTHEVEGSNPFGSTRLNCFKFALLSFLLMKGGMKGDDYHLYLAEN